MSMAPLNSRPGFISRIFSPGETAPYQEHGSEVAQRMAQADRDAVERGFYIMNRMNEAEMFAQRVINQPNEVIRAQLVPWFELHQQAEQQIYRRLAR